MKAEDDEGKASQELADDGQQVGFADPLAAGDQLPLGNDVDGIDMVEPLDAVVVALMDSIDADEPGTTLGCGRAPGANTAGSSLGLAVMDAALLVERVGAQVVQMRDRNGGQSLIASLTKEMNSPHQQHPGSGAGQS